MKTKNNIPSLVIILILLCACSCTKRDHPQPSESNFNLAVGNTWIYSESYYYNNIWDSLRSTRSVIRAITKDTLLEEDQLAYIVEETTGNYTRRYMWLEKDNQLIEAHFNYEHLNIIIANDLKKGIVWDMWPTVSTQDEMDKKSVIEAYSSYPILSKSVHAFRLQSGIADLLQSQKTGHLSEQVYAPAIGIIEETYYTNFYGPTRTVRVLTDYFIK